MSHAKPPLAKVTIILSEVIILVTINSLLLFLGVPTYYMVMNASVQCNDGLLPDIILLSLLLTLCDSIGLITCRVFKEKSEHPYSHCSHLNL